MTDDYATAPDEQTEVATPEDNEPEAIEADDDGQEVEAEDADQLDDDAEDDDAEDDGDLEEPETVDLEIDGETVKVPAKFKDAYMRHADYTRKTQEVAEQRKQFEAERESYAERQKIEAEVGESFQNLRAIDQQLKEYRELDWPRLQQENPDLAQNMLFQFNLLKDQRDVTAQEVSEKANEARSKMERERADHVAKNQEALRANIPDWNDARATEVKTFGKQLGFGDKEIETAIGNDWKVAKVLDLARIGQQVLEQRKQPKKARPAESKNVEPLPKAKGRASRNTGPTDRQSTAEWIKARNKQLSGG